MAATDRKNLGRALSSAALALLGAAPGAHAATLELWDVDASVLYYQEGEGRVRAIEPVIELKRSFSVDREARIRLTLDALTGASPSGATATTAPQTFTRPSGDGSYTVPSGKIPLDDTFRDTRVALNGSWKQPLDRDTTLTVGANASNEYDFFSLGGSTQVARDFHQKNTTLMFGLSAEFDRINPVGGVPLPFAVMAQAGQPQPRKGSADDKTVLDVILGLTQVINRWALMQFNYSFSQSNGYLTDPYKILSRIDPVTGVTRDNVYEHRPDSRRRQALFWLTRFHLPRDVVGVSYRYFFDNWGVKSHTVDLTYRWQWSEAQHLEPHLRIYRQSAADFARVNLMSGDPLPRDASADYRLAEFNGLTYGLKWGWKLPHDRELVLRFEYYTQVGESHPASAVGLQRGLDLYPDLKATIAQIQFRF